MPHDLPPWHTVYPQSQRWFRAGVFETLVIDLPSGFAWLKVEQFYALAS